MQQLFNYFKESWQEASKITWPNREQTIKLTIAVVIFSLLVAGYIAIFDYGLAELVRRVIVGE